MSESKSYPASDAPETPDNGEVILSLQTVHKMLPLVRRIAGDVVLRYAALAKIQPEDDKLDRQRHSLDWPSRYRRYQIKEEIANAEKELEVLLAELCELGLVCLDEAEGRIGFPTLVNNRRAYFSWVSAEKALRSWRFADEEIDRPIPASWLKELARAAT
ncbi:MAG: DUF2203 family protein [Gemmataceae bacterium]|nr:DUF2203 family protein [Gemmataceae bacterium]